MPTTQAGWVVCVKFIYHCVSLEIAGILFAAFFLWLAQDFRLLPEQRFTMFVVTSVASLAVALVSAIACWIDSDERGYRRIAQNVEVFKLFTLLRCSDRLISKILGC